PRSAVGSPWQQHPPLLLTAPPEKSTSTARLRQAGKPKLPLRASITLKRAFGLYRSPWPRPSAAIDLYPIDRGRAWTLQHLQRQGERCCHARRVHVVGKSYRFEGRLELACASP